MKINVYRHRNINTTCIYENYKKLTKVVLENLLQDLYVLCSYGHCKFYPVGGHLNWFADNRIPLRPSSNLTLGEKEISCGCCTNILVGLNKAA